MERLEEYAELRESLKSAQERQWELERQHEERGSHLRTAHQRAADAEEKAAATEESLAGLRRELTEARKLAERVPRLEQDLIEEQDRHKAVIAYRAAAEAELAGAKDEIASLREELGNVRSALAEEKAKVETFGNAVEQARALHSALAGMSQA